ncbi:inositol monophosphatase family protein [Candidatus Omnitrophota bacterium]
MEESARILNVAQEAAKEAGKYLLGRLGNIKEVSRKRGITDLVTDVDKGSEKIIIDRIKKSFPEHSILAEESGEHEAKGEVRWVIDPLDGTTNYAHCFPAFCVSIGVVIDGVVKVGVVYDPSRDELFTATEGRGAMLNKKPIKVSSVSTVQESLVATGFGYNVDEKMSNIGYFKVLLEKAQAVRRPGSAALDLINVACGRLDGFWELGLAPWDTAAGQLIVKEAGGTVTTMEGAPFDIYIKGIVATNSVIHDEMLSLLKGE